MAGFRIFGGGSGGGGGPVEGAPNFRKDIFAGFAIANTLRALVTQRVGFAINQVQALLRTKTNAGFAIETFASGTSLQNQAAGFTHNNYFAFKTPPPAASGYRLQTFITYTGQRYGQTAQNNGDGFTNPNNALGAPDGALASESGAALNAVSSQLILTMQDATGKDTLTIDQVLLRFYVSTTGTLLNNGNTTLQYRIAPNAFQTLETITANVNALTVPREFDITAQIAGSWDNIRAIETQVTHTSGALNTYTTNVDAVEIFIAASIED